MRRLTPEKRRRLDALLKAWMDAVMGEDHSALNDTVRGLK